MSELDVDDMRGRWRPGHVEAMIAHEEVTTFEELYRIACEDIAWLLDELDRLRAANAELRARLNTAPSEK